MVISIIIPAFNEEKNISMCLESIFRLNYPQDRFEVIVVDNGSTDRTRDIVGEYNVSLVVDDEKNVSGLRNLGACLAKGNILAFVDADCIVSADWLKNAEKYFYSLEIAAWGAPPVIPENATWVQTTWYLVRQKEKEVQEVEWLESMNLFVRSHLFNEIGGFNPGLITAEDVDFSYRISKFGTIVSDSNIKVVHRGEAATIKEFFRKEVWRGIGNFSGIKSHGLKFKELSSLGIPIYFGLVVPSLFLYSMVTQSQLLNVGVFMLYLCPSLIVLWKVLKKKVTRSIARLLILMVLLQAYFFARTIAVLKDA